ncbi:MAG TPA: hypothetical protein VFD58_28010 [Blastocatellia bacterium]|nr:hypothetical protein [Blastocatellia bacterium]
MTGEVEGGKYLYEIWLFGAGAPLKIQADEYRQVGEQFVFYTGSQRLEEWFIFTDGVTAIHRSDAPPVKTKPEGRAPAAKKTAKKKAVKK